MPITLRNTRQLALTFLFIILSLGLHFYSATSLFLHHYHLQVYAASSESEAVTVSGTVPVSDADGPTTPILVSPTNNSYVTISRPAFIWEASTDPSGVGHYDLSIDGSVLYGSIPTTDTDNSQYTLTYNSSTSRYTLTPKSNIADGSHTWKVRAVDNLGYGTDSATWNFTIDTQAPAFTLDQIGTASVTISAQDVSTIPATPIQLTANEPLLNASGEANSTVALTITIPGDPTQNYSSNITSGGGWNLQLGLFPRDVVITLDFTITDQAGNVSVLNGVQFTIPTQVIVIPPVSPTPTPVPGATATPTPTPVIPGTTSPSPSPSVTPSPTPGTPSITIPLIPPREIIHEVVQETTESLPEPVVAFVNALPAPIRQTINQSAPYSAALISAAIPLATAVAIGFQFGGNLSLLILLRILQALGLLPKGKAQGMVFNSQTYEPIPFALLTITSLNTQQTPITETVVTDVNGIYQGIQLPPGKYKMLVSHQDYIFPSGEKRPNYLSAKDFYLGESFTVVSQRAEKLFLIPVDPRQNSKKSVQLIQKVRLGSQSLARLFNRLMLPLAFISGLLFALFPSFWNGIIFAIYGVLVIKRAIYWFQSPQIDGTVIDKKGNPISKAMVRISLSEANQPMAIIRTDTQGHFAFYGPKAKFQISIVKPGYMWVDDSSSILSFKEINTTQTPQTIVATMQMVNELGEQII